MNTDGHRFEKDLMSVEPDFLVEDQLIVEIKAVKDLSGEHQSQLLNYLRATGLDAGLLVNFGKPRIQVKRLVN
ncbi:GxxExxY protein [Wenzhouxiangella sp. XN201]|nr:GxxExxY protein [Wenzhouxiangella sp. XN201]